MSTYDLKKAVGTVTGGNRVPFGFYMGAGANHLVISAAPADAVKGIEKETGDRLKPGFRGVCFREGEIRVFATKAAPTDTREMLLTKVLKAERCQNASKIELRQLGPDESDGTEANGVSGATLSGQWRVARETAVASVGALVGALRATGNGDAAKAGAVVEKLAAGFPASLDAAISGFEKAVAAGDEKAVSAARAQAKGQTAACLNYLQSNQRLIGLCENNPFGTAVAISGPLSTALTSIDAQLG